ncbi:winged helix-turn-helix domain-containing protein [Hymenobacter weizhouensis]|uniref:winged helix-turn-helix domain-containing protein n=1 Tax=Hymenobacter sp. YIM 151500-1 TaxID=2987689 RepID=UPI002227122D|nr:transcriptional regulator [Hymenobacter sp. YIM 151500-1]UYZ61677.1 transcriptional regulator [Hymenobacter sp. YIM 151500-1]
MAVPFEDLDPLLHSQLRLAVMSLLISVREAEFNFLKEKTGATAGNLSAQLTKLKDAGYLTLTKEFSGSYPLTRCAITPAGVAAFEAYVAALQRYLKPE